MLMTLSSAKSQNVSSESVKANLARTWKMSYVDDHGVRVTAKPETPEITYEFYADNTLAFYDGKKPSEKAMGKWSYDENKHNIAVQINDRPLGSIISLSSDTMRFEIVLPNSPPPYHKTQMVLVSQIRAATDPSEAHLTIDSNSKLFFKPDESTLLIKSKISKAAVYINPNIWQLTTPQSESNLEFNFITKSSNGWASLSFEHVPTDLAKIPQIALNNLKKSSAVGEVVYSEYRVVNNTKLLYVGMRETTVKGYKLIFLSYYYSYEKGVIQLSAYTTEGHWNDTKKELQHLLDGLVILDK
jgi:hypothetical protein